jgi:hypothetical protein
MALVRLRKLAPPGLLGQLVDKNAFFVAMRCRDVGSIWRQDIPCSGLASNLL